MDLTLTQWIVAILIFLGTTFALARATYNHYKQESGPRFWNTRGGKTNYFRLLVLASMGVTVIVMAFIKTIMIS